MESDKYMVDERARASFIFFPFKKKKKILLHPCGYMTLRYYDEQLTRTFINVYAV